MFREYFGAQGSAYVTPANFVSEAGREEITSGHFRSVDDLIVTSVHVWREKHVASSEAQDTGAAAAARLKAGDMIRELRKGVTLDRPKGMSLREYAHIGHKY